MTFLAPSLLLLLIPLGLFVGFAARVPGPAWGLRFALAAALGLALARPELRTGAAGSDVVVLVDRSRSMPAGSEATAEELIRLVERDRREGDRLGVMTFGRAARVEMPLDARAGFAGFREDVGADASNLAGALDAVAELLPTERRARVLVITDGRATGADAKAAARRLAARGVAIDYRLVARAETGLDVAVTGLEAPAAVAAREPFQLTAVLRATQQVTAQVTLSRNGAPLSRFQRALPPGETLLTLRDLVEQPGLASYQLEVEAPGDRTAENDVGRAVVRVEGPAQVLLMTENPSSTLATTLAKAGLELKVLAPGPLSMQALEGVGAVVLEDLEASALTEAGLRVLAQAVREAGVGLLMTGGRHSFGEGGYRKSPLEEVLPVSLEVREEQRKAAVALSIIMDCSCSMGVTVPDGRTKMELAAEGVVGALQLLDERDEAAVSMVDTEPHSIFDLSPVSAGLPLGKVARGFSGGGGILVGVGLREARAQILKSQKPTRHVVLFADAADSTDPDDYRATLGELRRKNVTVSVIGMGSRKDSDAKLLEEVAALGGGRIYFAEDVASLPRIFSQETIAVARSTFVDVKTATTASGDLALLGRFTEASAPTLGGYNVTYLRPQASLAYRSDDATAAPIVAFWQKGAGKVAAFTGEVDGAFTGDFKRWPGARALLEALTRWSLPPTGSANDAVARARLEGDALHVTLDFDLRQGAPAALPTVVILSGDGKQLPVQLPMRMEDEDRAGATFTLPGTGTFHPVVKLGERVFRAAPVTLSYAPEFEPGDPRAGRVLLQALAALSGGHERLNTSGLFEEAGQSLAQVALGPWLVCLAVALLLAEVLLRRFFSTATPRARPRGAALAGVVRTTSGEVRVVAAPPLPAIPPPAAAAPPSPEAPPPKPAAPGVADALSAARERAKRRTDR